MKISETLIEYLRSCKNNHALFNDALHFRKSLDLLNAFRPDLTPLAIAKYDFQRKKVSLTQFGAKVFRARLGMALFL